MAELILDILLQVNALKCQGLIRTYNLLIPKVRNS